MEQKRITISRKDMMEPLEDMFGIFFEDLNHAADGGLYAEMVQNRSFEFLPIDRQDYHPLYAWEKVEQSDAAVTLEIRSESPFCVKNPHYLVADAVKTGSGAGFRNLGFNSGFAVKKGENYLFTCYAKNLGDQVQRFQITLHSSTGGICGSTEITVDFDEWKKYEAVICCTEEDTAAKLTLLFCEPGRTAFDFISLFPEHTFMGRRNGMRADIAGILQAMKPKFMRFPGGCLVHDGSLDPDARDSMYRWKNTIGPVELRPARRSNWGYNQTLGLGYYEYFQFCEDIGAKPLPVLPGGYDPHHQRIVPLDELGPWIEDALDLIEFANGSPDTKWGAVRAGLGHPKPFGLSYIAIGNEEVGDAFFERYPYFHRAIKKRYPDIRIIGTSGPNAAGTEYEKGWKCAVEWRSDLVDEHYYQAPEWFIANHHRYDTFSADGPKVFLGEYATWGNTWYNALTEASFMCGLERNARSVGLACYAPMLANVDYVNWKPDMIWLDNHRVYGTPNYYVQKLFMNHQGSRRLNAVLTGLEAETVPEAPIHGEVRLQGYESVVKYSEGTIRNERTGEEIAFGELTLDKEAEPLRIARTSWEDYTIRCLAQELEGTKGFRIYWGWRDEKEYFSWTTGGWQNYDVILSHRINGAGCDLSQGLFHVEQGRVYELELRVRGRRFAAYIDGVLCLSAEDKQAVTKPLYHAASLDETDGAVILKAVNLRSEPLTVQVVLNGMEEQNSLPLRGLSGKVYTMCGALEAENDFDQPERIAPVETDWHSEQREFIYEFTGDSLTVFRLYPA